MHLRGSEWGLVTLCAAIIFFQILIPPVVGLADEGDFAKMSQRFYLGPDNHSNEDAFFYFHRRYIYDPQLYHWNAEIFSSELGLIHLATALNDLISKDQSFDIRVLGVLHAAIFLAAFGLFLPMLRGLPRIVRLGLPLFAIFVFADVSYVSYFNSFLTDPAAFLFLACAIALGLRLTSGITLTRLALFAAAAILLIVSKPQHSFAGIPLALFLLWASLRLRLTVQRIAAMALTLLLLAAIPWTIRKMPRHYSGDPLFSMSFYKIPGVSHDAVRDLRDLGLGERYDRYIGHHAYEKDNPVDDNAWREQFLRDMSYGRLCRFYLRHPGRALAIIARDLRETAPAIRPPNVGNFERQEGYPPMSKSRAFALWSDRKGRYLKRHPFHIVIYYAAGLLLATIVAVRQWRRGAVPVVPGLCVTVLLMGVIEFLVASLADALDTERHLFLFHAATDIALCFALAGIGMLPRLALQRDRGADGRLSARELTGQAGDRPRASA